MPDPISRQRLKKKALDRWENEGGRSDTDGAGTTRSRVRAKVADKNKAPLFANERADIFDGAHDKNADGVQATESAKRKLKGGDNK